MNNFQPRTYRRRVRGAGLTSFRVVTRQTDLHVQVEPPEDEDSSGGIDDYRQLAARAIRRARNQVSEECGLRDGFADARQPLSIREEAPAIVRRMYRAGRVAAVGPMAAVAGVIAEFVGRALLQRTRQVIVENGGDIFLRTDNERTVAVHAGKSQFSDNIGLVIPASETLGVCTSSGTVGHSDSTGTADAAVAVCDDTAIADACATALGNRIGQPDDIEPALQWIAAIDDIRGAVAVCDDAMGAWGEFDIANPNN